MLLPTKSCRSQLGANVTV